MKYTVSIDEKNRTITVTLADGTTGTAHCCPTDHFNISTGIELALERAKVAKANTAKTTTIAKAEKKMSIMELVKALENALPEGEMVLVGKGENMTEAQKKWLRSLIGEGCSCGNCSCDDDADEAYQRGYEDGYDDGFDNGKIVTREEYEGEITSLEEEIEALEEQLSDSESTREHCEAVIDDIIHILEERGEL